MYQQTILPEWLAVLCASVLLFLVVGVIALDGHTLAAGAVLTVYAVGWFWAFWPATGERTSKVVAPTPATDSRSFLEAMRRFTAHRA